MAKRLGVRHEMNQIKKIRDNSSKKHEPSNRNIYRSDSGSSLSSDSDWDKIRHPDELK